MLVPLDRPVLGLSVNARIVTGCVATLAFLLLLAFEPSKRRRVYVALAVPLAILVFAPINTSLALPHVLRLGIAFLAVVVIPPLILRDRSIITFKFWPERIDNVDVLYTLLSIPLAWGGFQLYFYLSPDVPYNWQLGATPDNTELFSLFMGINAVGIWDELFFINICYALLRSLFSYRTANLAQAVIYTSVLYDMAFSGWGPAFVYTLAITQGVMYERSKVLLWVLIVHLIVDYFLVQAIISHYYPQLSVWWHP